MNTQTTTRPTAGAAKLGTVTPYLCFHGRCEEALRFYQQVLGAQITSLARFSDLPPGACEMPIEGNNVMHAAFRVGQSELFASDGCPGEAPAGGGYSLSVAIDEPATVDALASQLAVGGRVDMPPDETFFARRFAIVTDRFGVSWMLIAPAAEKAGAGA